MAEHLAAASTLQAEVLAEIENKRPSLRRRAGLRVAAVQALLFTIGWYVFTTPSFSVLPIADDLLRGRMSLTQTVAILIVFSLALTPVLMVVGIGAKWVIIGRYKPGAVAVGRILISAGGL